MLQIDIYRHISLYFHKISYDFSNVNDIHGGACINPLSPSKRRSIVDEAKSKLKLNGTRVSLGESFQF